MRNEMNVGLMAHRSHLGHIDANNVCFDEWPEMITRNESQRMCPARDGCLVGIQTSDLSITGQRQTLQTIAPPWLHGIHMRGDSLWSWDSLSELCPVILMWMNLSCVDSPGDIEVFFEARFHCINHFMHQCQTPTIISI